MVRGTTYFTCDECGHRFKALDIEYGATIYSMPQPCPKCGSCHTMPGFLSAMPGLRRLNPSYYIYRRIWAQQDGSNSNGSNR